MTINHLRFASQVILRAINEGIMTRERCEVHFYTRENGLLPFLWSHTTRFKEGQYDYGRLLYWTLDTIYLLNSDVVFLKNRHAVVSCQLMYLLTL